MDSSINIITYIVVNVMVVMMTIGSMDGWGSISMDSYWGSCVSMAYWMMAYSSIRCGSMTIQITSADTSHNGGNSYNLQEKDCHVLNNFLSEIITNTITALKCNNSNNITTHLGEHVCGIIAIISLQLTGQY